MIPSPLEQIKVSLIALDAGMKGADTRAMLENMEQLDRLVAAHKQALDARLAHFLERRSYAKALDYLAGETAIPVGNCAPKAPTV